jgi:hypothetical protein
MPKRSSNAEPEDVNEIAARVVGQATGNGKSEKPKKNPAAVSLGRLGGKKGGKARAEKLSAERRQEIAREAANRRWNKGSA